MRTFHTFFCLLLAPFFSHAQFSIQYIHDYGETIDAYRSIAINAQGNYVLGGESGSRGVFLEIRPDGLVLQEKILPAPHGSRYLIPTAGGYIAGVVRQYDYCSTGEAASSVYISGLDGSGNTLWLKPLDYTENYEYARIAGLFLRPGYPDELCVATANKVYRLNISNGSILSQTALGLGLNGQFLTHLEPADDGYRAFQFLPGAPDNARMLWYDADFNIVQEKIVPRGTVTPATGGGWYLFNAWTTGGQQPTFFHYTIHKLDPNGQVIFSRVYEYAEYAYMEGYRLNGVFEVGGELWIPGTLNRKPFVKRLSASSGAELDPVPLGAFSGEAAGIQTILPAPDGAVLLAGATQGGESLPWQSDALLLALAPGGSTGAQSPQTVLALLPYPNPATDRLNIPAGAEGRLEVYDASGRTALRLDAVPADRALALRSLPAGAYMLRIFSPEGVAWAGRFEVRR